MEGVFHNRYISSRPDEGGPGIVILGCPLDVTSSFRGGSKFGPESLRKASWTLETYSPYLGLDLDDMDLFDAGDLELPQGNLPGSLDRIEKSAARIIGPGRKPLFLGGEHLVTYPLVKSMMGSFPLLQLVHFDAHCDLRDEYEGEKLSHATVMKRVRELGISGMHQIGIRSGTRQEFAELSPVHSPDGLAGSLERDIPIYISFDIDVFDPSLMSGVTTPEPGGLMFGEVMDYLSVLKGMDIVGADLVELAPDYDTTFVSSVCAAKVAREIVMLLHSGIK
ncbi:MAG TPA: agmatinase [Syntrophorhabdaceae bacterium]|nr:agmatinase [Syntrophorhabdaceae bacterium]HOD74856.1 agmatinase [Syntrophorhabdaceae bacterium]